MLRFIGESIFVILFFCLSPIAGLIAMLVVAAERFVFVFAMNADMEREERKQESLDRSNEQHIRTCSVARFHLSKNMFTKHYLEPTVCATCYDIAPQGIDPVSEQLKLTEQFIIDTQNKKNDA